MLIMHSQSRVNLTFPANFRVGVTLGWLVGWFLVGSLVGCWVLVGELVRSLVAGRVELPRHGAAAPALMPRPKC